MTTENQNDVPAGRWKTPQVYAMAAICLLIGLALGFFFRGSAPVTAAASPSVANTPPTPNAQPQQMPSLDQMKHMADKKAEPLLAKLKDNPKDVDTLKQVARIYEATHQFQDAAGYFSKILEVNPKDTAIRNEMASCLYYNGDVEGAISQLQQSVQDNPGDANSLFNLGLIRWKGKNDTKGAQQAWQQLLKSNPKLASDKKTQVEKLIAEVSKVHAN